MNPIQFYLQWLVTIVPVQSIAPNPPQCSPLALAECVARHDPNYVAEGRDWASKIIQESVG